MPGYDASIHFSLHWRHTPGVHDFFKNVTPTPSGCASPHTVMSVTRTVGQDQHHAEPSHRGPDKNALLTVSSGKFGNQEEWGRGSPRGLVYFRGWVGACPPEMTDETAALDLAFLGQLLSTSSAPQLPEIVKPTTGQ